MPLLEASEIFELEVELEFDVTPFRAGCNYMPNGDPGYPDEGGDADLAEAHVVFQDPKTKAFVRFQIPDAWLPYLTEQIDRALERAIDERDN